MNYTVRVLGRLRIFTEFRRIFTEVREGRKERQEKFYFFAAFATFAYFV